MNYIAKQAQLKEKREASILKAVISVLHNLCSLRQNYLVKLFSIKMQREWARVMGTQGKPDEKMNAAQFEQLIDDYINNPQSLQDTYAPGIMIVPDLDEMFSQFNSLAR